MAGLGGEGQTFDGYRREPLLRLHPHLCFYYRSEEKTRAILVPDQNPPTVCAAYRKQLENCVESTKGKGDEGEKDEKKGIYFSTNRFDPSLRSRQIL